MATRPIILVIEVEQPEGLSARKLVLETAKYNVLTAYSGEEGLQTFERSPADLVVVHSAVQDIPCESIVEHIKSKMPSLPVVVASPSDSWCTGADFMVSSYDPAALLQVVQKIVAKAS
jgi:DNA-binding response OmpR family regulator